MPTWTVEWVLGAFYVGVKWLGHEADPTLPSAAEVKNELSNMSPSGVPRGGGFGGVQTPQNSEGPPKSCQTQPNCENC